MCGIAGIFNPSGGAIDRLGERLERMNALQKHRGPDDEGLWLAPDAALGMGHVRLSVLDLSERARQPMREDEADLTIVFNGEIYNFRELRARLESKHRFRTQSDTEVILKAYMEWGEACPEYLRGMFAFAIWDARRRRLFLARDRFGIKPLYVAWSGETLYFASEIKALFSFLPDVRIDRSGLRDYLTFQFCLRGKTLFENIEEVAPATWRTVDSEGTRSHTYWKVRYDLDMEHGEAWFVERCRELMEDSIRAHVVSDVPVSGYLSGGIDSSGIAALARRATGADDFMAFHGVFRGYGERFDESGFARDVARREGIDLREIPVSSDDFVDAFDRLIYHMDFPVAGPGSFPQYVVSKYVKGKRKVVLGGQGADEIFGGYVRYLIAYFEQCLKGAVAGESHSPRFIVTYESIIPNLQSLAGYEPLMRHFFSAGMFDDYDRRYFRLIDRSAEVRDEVRWDAFPRDYDVYEEFRRVYFSNEIGSRCYFDSMLHFDFLTLLPALLQVEDRTSMAHGVESRTPFLDHPLVEFVATIPANVKFRGGELKRLPKLFFGDTLPASVLGRKDKMGFPVPLVQWYGDALKEFVEKAFGEPSQAAREFLDFDAIRRGLPSEPSFGRKIWGFLCLNSFCRQFLDNRRPFV
ncbi:asparagine synthase (glutamine-hydrolyzing) [Candidatus Sumerlaeota bacterium]|nr:asparagine synthase (glutamine-hydrolyzing) [Candidatus Sumerlaeota bacterium]